MVAGLPKEVPMLLRFLFLTMTIDATGGQALWSIPLPLIGVTSVYSPWGDRSELEFTLPDCATGIRWSTV